LENSARSPPICSENESDPLLHAVFDKTAWLREREISEPWPIAGLPDALHVDKGADFKSKAFKRGCDDAGVAIIWRPPWTTPARRPY
jgi:transposase InsO family protein